MGDVIHVKFAHPSMYGPDQNRYSPVEEKWFPAAFVVKKTQLYHLPGQHQYHQVGPDIP